MAVMNYFDGQDWVLRVPGGAIAKFADPTVSRGWGLTYDGIDSIPTRLRQPRRRSSGKCAAKMAQKGRCTA